MQTNYCNTNHILVGLGGTGGKILKAFKMRMFEEFPIPEEREKLPVSLLYVDSTDEMMPKDGRPNPDFRVMGQDASFTQREFLNIKSVDVSVILDNLENYPQLKGIVKDARAVKKAIGNLGTAAGQMRRAGRLLFAANAVGYVNALRDAFARCSERSGNQRELFIHIFAGLCGGTGSGSIIDAIVQARKTYPSADIAVYAMIPEQHLPKANIDQGRYYQNGYAALMELNALQSGRFIPHDVTGEGESINVYNVRYNGVANGLTLYSNVNENGMALNPFTELPKTVSDYIYGRIFLIKNEDGEKNGDIVRAYTFENCNQFAQEYDELADKNNCGEDGLPVARTKKVNSFGIKRVMYPELRILRHMTYSVGESVLYQFKYNNWREDTGFVNEALNRDFRELYFSKSNLGKWMLDLRHLMLDVKILPTDKDYPDFKSYWSDKAHGYAEDPSVKNAACPLTELDALLGDFYAKQFRSMGVETYFKEKTKSLSEMAAEIRRVIEHELFGKWRDGDISIVELQKISGMLLAEIDEIKKKIDEELVENGKDVEAIQCDCQDNVGEWSNLGILQRIAKVGNRIYARHQDDLAELYEARTVAVALLFAKSLASKVQLALQNMDADISSFSQIINSAIESVDKMVTAQKKVNKGLEDMKGAIIEVSEDAVMEKFEVELKVNSVDMHTIAGQIRQYILPQSEFVNFGELCNDVSVDSVKDAFDIELTKIIRAKHDERSESDVKVLGLNILQQLQQKLVNEEDINSFAFKIMAQSGVYLCMDNNQMQMQVRNNEGDLSPSNHASINKKVVFVSIPKPENDRQIKFAKSLEAAFKGSIKQGNETTSIVFDMQSPRSNELQIITVLYCFPMRCIDWLKTYRDRYEHLLKANYQSNSILLHSEGDGTGLPSIFVVKNAESPAPSSASAAAPAQGPSPVGMPPVNGGMPVPPTVGIPEPVVQMFFNIAGQNYGPYDYKTCKQLKSNNQINEQTLAWQQGMAAWTPAGQVPELKALFAPVPPAAPGMPPLPPMPGTPQMPPVM